MQDKFTLNREQILFLTNKKLEEAILCAMKLQGNIVTLPYIQSVLDGKEDTEEADALAVKKFKSAWESILSSLDEPVSMESVCKLRGILSPDLEEIPCEQDAERELDSILNGNRSRTRKGINIFLWALKRKLFGEDSAVVGFLAANKYLAANGAGVFIIKPKDYALFDELSAEFHSSNTNDMGKFLYENAIDGMKVVVHRRV